MSNPGSRGGRPGRVPAGLVLFLVLILALAGPAIGSTKAGPGSKTVSPAGPWEPLIERLAADGLDQKELKRLFDRSGVGYDPDPMKLKMRTLYDNMFGRKPVLTVQKGLKRLGYSVGPLDGRYGPKTRQAIMDFQEKHSLTRTGLPDRTLRQKIEARVAAKFKCPQPKARKAGGVYRSALTKTQLAKTHRYLTEHRPLLQKVRHKYGVPEEIAVGILTVETKVGTYLGHKRALNTLASMALCSDFKRVAAFFQKSELGPVRSGWLKKRSRDKALWAYQELKALLKYARVNRADPLSFVGSIYGAIGISQFMPTNALKFGQDGDGDGRVDLFRHEDAVHSLGAYLEKHGWEKQMTTEKKRRVLYAYNHSQTYVNTVLAVADYLSRKTKAKSPGKSAP